MVHAQPNDGARSLLVRLALQRDEREARLQALASSVQALDLRLARILAWLRDQPLETLGYPGWQVFCRERVDWGESWVRDMVRLVRSGLSVVIGAACRSEIPLSLATQAPGWCLPEAQDVWVDLARKGALPPRPVGRPRGASALVEPTEHEALVVWHARHKARLLDDGAHTDRQADERILAWWRARRTDLVDVALATRPRPAPAEGSPEWDEEDPASPLLGTWRTPTTLAEGLARLDEVQAARKGRAAALGRGYEEVVRLGLHRAWGYGSVEAFCQVALGLSARSLQRYREQGRALRRHPELEALPLTKAEAVARAEKDIDRWRVVAERTGVGELQKAIAHVEAGADPQVLLDAYEAAMAATTDTVALADLQRPVPPRLTDRVHPDLPEAAAWLLLEVEIPKQRGFGRVKERVDYVCGNPECRLRALRNHGHHRIWRSRGGADTLENGECVCPSCHLRVIHPGHADVTREGQRVRWALPGRAIMVFLGALAF